MTPSPVDAGAEIEQQAQHLLPAFLDDYLGPQPESTVETHVSVPGGRADLRIKHGDWVFVVEVKSSSRSAPVAHAALQARHYADALGGIPLVVVPFMGDTGRELCRELGVGFIDLAGNAHFEAADIHVHVAGKPKRFVQRGRPASPFALRSSRITRALLADPDRSWIQNELAAAVGLDPGSVSRTVRRLEGDGFVSRHSRRLQVLEAGLLVDAWAEDYASSRQRARDHLEEGGEREGIGLSPPRRIRKPLAHVVELLADCGAWAVTGTTACQMLLDLPIDFPARVLVERPLDLAVATVSKWLRVPFEEAAVWVEPAPDVGVFYGCTSWERLRAVSWGQAFVEARNQREPGPELALALRAKVLGEWGAT
jgi:hypothetical protein